VHATGHGDRRSLATALEEEPRLFFAIPKLYQPFHLHSTSLYTCILQVYEDIRFMNSTAEPKLAPPGAGLPKPELFIARLIFAVQSRLGNRDSFNARFIQERQAIRHLVATCDASSAATRVLIQRLPGLEDSSRYWSLWMTLDHLRIVNHSVARTITSLLKEIPPTGQASAAAVKPNPAVDSSVVDAFEKSCDAVLAAVSAAPNLKTRSRYMHPWFGPLDASGWHAMSGSHLSIHRKQIARILQGLSSVDTSSNRNGHP